MKIEKDLKKGEVICNKCLGVGSLDVPGNERLRKVCQKCYGEGKIDWIENVVGKALIEFDIEEVTF
ncbi:hypothetical protein KAR91_15710 [Candidatus Pacearchaeota archaeon]|nr:hypothetical protein [Candidatus Pacearchaeota archaeon]